MQPPAPGASENFTFVLIPIHADGGYKALQEITRSKAGGLRRDELLVYASEHFAPGAKKANADVRLCLVPPFCLIPKSIPLAPLKAPRAQREPRAHNQGLCVSPQR